MRSAARLLAEGGAEAVKLEGGRDFTEVVRRVVRAGIPVMGHVGLTPQSVHRLGGYVVQGKDEDRARQLLRDAQELEAAGCYAVVLECVPAELARFISGRLQIPTIGIGAGPDCDGQVLVLNDLLGMDTSFKPKFVKRFGAVGDAVTAAVDAYVREVRGQTFPAEEHSFHAPTLRLLHAVEEEPRDDAQVVGAPV